jgi:hypothetical protein
MEQPGSHWTDFHKIWYLIFWKSVEKIQVSLKSGKNNVYFSEYVSTFMKMSGWILLRMRNVSDIVVEKIKTHFLCSVTFFWKPFRLWDVENYFTAWQTIDYSIIRRMRFACGLTKATDTHSQYVDLTLIAFHGNNDYAIARQCYVYKYIACIVI